MANEQWIFGINAVHTALQTPSAVREIWLDHKRNDQRINELQTLAEQAGIPVHAGHRKTLDDKLAQNNTPNAKHQGVVARVEAPPVLGDNELKTLLENLDQPPFLLILDGVQDPHNLGACLRSADAAGVHAVIAPKDRAVSLTPTAIKVASGAASTTPFFQITNLARTLRDLKDSGIWLVGLDGQSTQSLYETDLKGPLAILMGAEGQGLRRLTKELVDYLVQIPMVGNVESLNVSVATGICLFEALRQRSI